MARNAVNLPCSSGRGDLVHEGRGGYVHQVTTDGGGNWMAVWCSEDTFGATIGTDRDILVARWR